MLLHVSHGINAYSQMNNETSVVLNQGIGHANRRQKQRRSYQLDFEASHHFSEELEASRKQNSVAAGQLHERLRVLQSRVKMST